VASGSDFLNLLMEKQIRTYLEKHLPEYLDILKQMVRVNSFSGNPDGVNRVGELTGEVFSSLGFDAQQVQAENPLYGKHLILTKPGSSQLKIGMITHMDTVFPPEEEEAHDFHWREDGDLVFGPGTNDCKGGTVLMLMTLSAIKEFLPEVYDKINWVLLLNAAEERLSEDFGALCLSRLGKDALAALVFEAGVRNGNVFQLVTSRKGRCTFDVQVDGKSAHAGSSHSEGANAIVQLAHTIQRIAGLTDYSRDLTFNVGTVRGGTVVNRVPHQAHATVEMRAFSQDVFDDGVRKMLVLQEEIDVASHKGKYPCRVSIRMRNQAVPWPENPATQNLLAVWQQAAAPLGFSVIPEARGGLSDGNALCRIIPTIDGLGPHGANAHCSESSEDGTKQPEYVDKSSFVPKALLNTLAIARLAETAG